MKTSYITIDIEQDDRDLSAKIKTKIRTRAMNDVITRIQDFAQKELEKITGMEVDIEDFTEFSEYRD